MSDIQPSAAQPMYNAMSQPHVDDLKHHNTYERMQPSNISEDTAHGGRQEDSKMHHQPPYMTS